MTSAPSLPDLNVAARKAAAKLQRLENAAAKREGRPPVDKRAEALAARRAARAARNA